MFVSAALCLRSLIERLHKTNIDWHLKEEEKPEILLKWLRNSIRKVEMIEKDFLLKQKI